MWRGPCGVTCASCGSRPKARSSARLGSLEGMPNLSPSLLAILRCPVTGSSLVQDGDALVATEPGPDGTAPRYPIEDGIPVLLAPTTTADPQEHLA